MRCTAVQRVSKVSFDWIFEIRVGKLMRITCVFNAFSTRIRQGQIDGRFEMIFARVYLDTCMRRLNIAQFDSIRMFIYA